MARDLDYSNVESTSAEPEASSMIETFRAIGYSIEAAIADIIDNSISAKATNIYIDYDWQGSDTILTIRDDGCGMNEKELKQALRPGSTNPLDLRDKHDLGRFGLGLKTASLSQCRKFAVVSKKQDTAVSYWCWDLDYVNYTKRWLLIKVCPNSEYFTNQLNQQAEGTTVVWWDMDRLTKNTQKDSTNSKNKFFLKMDKVKKHLAMVFHRYIEDGINIYFQGRKIDSWEPFMNGEKGVQVRPATELEEGRISIQGFVLPQRSRLTPTLYDFGKGSKGSWTAHQGFYVYRNDRLIVAGDWLGFFKQESHYDLCRIRIDLPNDVDDSWQIDIKKSVARVPPKYKDTIQKIAEDIRSRGLGVYRHKGKSLQRRGNNDYCPLWQEMLRQGKRFYMINRDYPMIKELLENHDGLSTKIEKLLRFIEETVPVPFIKLKEDEGVIPHGQPFEGTELEEVKEIINSIYNSLIEKGKTPEQAKEIIKNTEPFDIYYKYVESLI